MDNTDMTTLTFFHLTDICLYGQPFRWEGQWEAMDSDNKAASSDKLTYGDMIEANGFEALWHRATSGFSLPSNVCAPDFEKVLDFTVELLALGCTWIADCWNGDWQVWIHDQIRDRSIDWFEASTLEGGLESALRDDGGRLGALGETRTGYPQPEPWLARAMRMAVDCPDVLKGELSGRQG